MKRTLRIGTAILLAGLPFFSANADYPASSYTLSADGKELTAWKGDEKDIDLASDPAFDNVESIANWVFMDKDITSIVLPGSLKQLGLAVFSGCTQLESISLPESLESIGNSQFYDCRSLKEIVIPSKITSLPKGCFNSCSSLESISLPDGITLIDEEAFKGCGLRDFTMPESLECIEAYAFEECDLSGTVRFGSLINAIGTSAFSGSGIVSADLSRIKPEVSIGFNAFQNCRQLKEALLPAMVAEVSSGMFTNCVQLERIVIPSSWQEVPVKLCYGCTGLREVNLGNVVTIGNTAFFGCESLEQIEWSQSLETIDWNVFYECKALSRLELPESLISIDDYSFSACDALQSIHLGSHVQSLGQECFSMNSNLEKVICEASTPPSLGSYAFYKSNTDAAVLEVPEESIDLYKKASQWKDFSKIEKVPVGVAAIGEENPGFVIVKGGVETYSNVDIRSVTGILVSSGKGGKINLAPGVYIVITPERSVKISIR